MFISTEYDPYKYKTMINYSFYHPVITSYNKSDSIKGKVVIKTSLREKYGRILMVISVTHNLEGNHSYSTIKIIFCSCVACELCNS